MKVKIFEYEFVEIKEVKSEFDVKVDVLEKKVVIFMIFYKEQDFWLQGLCKEKEKLEKEVNELQVKVDKFESENIKLCVRKLVDGSGGFDDEGMEELENEEKIRLKKQICSLEVEVYELWSGVWIEKCWELEGVSFGF